MWTFTTGLPPNASAIQDRVDGGRCLAVIAFKHVDIDRKRDARLRVPQALGDRDDVHPCAIN